MMPEKTFDPTTYVTVQELADMLDLTKGRIRQMIGANEVEAIKRGGAWWITPDGVVQAVNRNSKPGPKRKR